MGWSSCGVSGTSCQCRIEYNRALTFSDEKMPSHRRPLKMRVFSSSSLKVVLALMVATRSFSSDDGAEMIFWAASFQGIDSLQKLCSSSLRKPMSTRTLTNSGKPAYLKVPLGLCQKPVWPPSIRGNVPNNSLYLRHAVALLVWSGITVGISNKRKPWKS